jgi:hypothetical protein
VADSCGVSNKSRLLQNNVEFLINSTIVFLKKICLILYFDENIWAVTSFQSIKSDTNGVRLKEYRSYIHTVWGFARDLQTGFGLGSQSSVVVSW